MSTLRRFVVTFPPDAGQWAGAHAFQTQRERARFMVDARKRGAPTMAARMSLLTPGRARAGWGARP